MWEPFGISLSRSSCLNYLHRLGFVLQRPKKRLLQAAGEKREAFVAEYAAMRDEAGRTGGKIFFADEAHFRADAQLRSKWALKGEPALVETTSPRYGEQASYYSAVCLETGEVEWMELEGTSNAATSANCLGQLPGPTEGKASWLPDGNLRQRSRPPGRGGERVPAKPGSGLAAGEPRVKHGAGSAGLPPRLQSR